MNTNQSRRSLPELPAFEGRPVQQRHANQCAGEGHLTHMKDGVVQPHCPRCGVDLRPAVAAAELLKSVWRAHADQLDRSAYPSDQMIADEDRAWNALIDFVEENGLNSTPSDPRPAAERELS